MSCRLRICFAATYSGRRNLNTQPLFSGYDAIFSNIVARFPDRGITMVDIGRRWSNPFLVYDTHFFYRMRGGNLNASLAFTMNSCKRPVEKSVFSLPSNSAISSPTRKDEYLVRLAGNSEPRTCSQIHEAPRLLRLSHHVPNMSIWF